jgi:tripartite-type tricarboxylate transporter receptor subunit TctC
VARLNSETLKALDSPVLKERLSTLGLEPAGSSTSECAKHIEADIKRWAPVIKIAGAKAD